MTGDRERPEPLVEPDTYYSVPHPMLAVDRDSDRCRDRRAGVHRLGDAAMTDHDPLCQRYEPDHWCECALIARVRADERERIADLIHAKFGPISSRSHDSGCVCSVCIIRSTLDGVSDWLKGNMEGDDEEEQRERMEKVLTEAWGAAKASWRSGGGSYWEGRMDALDYAIRIVEGGER